MYFTLIYSSTLYRFKTYRSFNYEPSMTIAKSQTTKPFRRQTEKATQKCSVFGFCGEAVLFCCWHCRLLSAGHAGASGAVCFSGKQLETQAPLGKSQLTPNQKSQLKNSAVFLNVDSGFRLSSRNYIIYKVSELGSSTPNMRNKEKPPQWR